MGQKKNTNQTLSKEIPHERRERCEDEGWKRCSVSKRRAGRKVLESWPAEVEFTSLWVLEDQASSVPYSCFFLCFVSCPFSERWHWMKRNASIQFFSFSQIASLTLIHLAALNRQAHYRCMCERADCQTLMIAGMICPAWSLPTFTL